MSACLLDKDLTLLCATVTVGLDFEWAEWEGGASVTAAAYVTLCLSAAAAAAAADFKLRTFCQNVLPITVVGLVTEAGIRSKKVVSFH